MDVQEVTSCVGQRTLDQEELRAWLRKMSDAQLLEFGKAAASMCKSMRTSNRPVREVFREQLREALAEWRRHFPNAAIT
jgi:hypothetical protein